MSSSELDQLKRLYENNLSEKINTNLSVLTDTIVESFGEEHREIITQRIQAMNILFYMDAKTIETAINSGKYAEEENVFYGALLDDIRLTKLVISSDSEENKKNNLNRKAKSLFRIVGNGQLANYLNENFIDTVVDNERVSNVIKSTQNMSLLEFASDETRHHSLIVLPFLKVGDKTLIHEILHLLGFNEKVGSLPKSGLVVPSSYSDNRIRKGITDIDENYVERKAEEIAKKLEEKGVSILPPAVYHEYSSYNSINGTLDGLFNRHDSLFASATFSTDKDVLKETLGNELLSKIGQEVYELGSGSGYALLPGQAQKEKSDEFCEEVSRRIIH